MGVIHAFLHFFLGAFAPGSGRRRAVSRRTRPAPAARPQTTHRAARPLPAHRSPYGQYETFDSATITLVRPYLIAHERRQERLRIQRRRTLVLAADFSIDLATLVQHRAGAAR
ncbi:hypothetical protein [Streptomyces sp. NPDC047928]|uniref:hypothetical protein n=1 Tax=unclassified Streptomyces TaxID=2593676 RepID=UPI003719F862